MLEGAHIGLNLVFLVPDETGGMETYARELVPAMVEERPDLKFTAFVNREAAESNFDFAGGAIQSVTVPVRSRRRWDWVRGEQQLLPRLAARRGIDLLHSLGNTAPTWGNFRRVVTVHDLIHRIHPEAHFGLASFGMRWLVQLAIGRTDRVVVPSRNTKDDIVRLVGTSPDRIDVAPNGVRPPQVPAADPLELRSRLGLGDRPVVMTASAMRPHKNLLRLLDALALVPVEQRPSIRTYLQIPDSARGRAPQAGVQVGNRERDAFSGLAHVGGTG